MLFLPSYLPVSISLFEEAMNGAESELVISYGAVLAAESHVVGVGADATHPNPTVLVANHTQLDALARV